MASTVLSGSAKRQYEDFDSIDKNETEVKKIKTEVKTTENSAEQSNNNQGSEIQKIADYTSEIFKIEIIGLPKHTGYAELKKILCKMGLEPKKLKLPNWHGGALVTFANEEGRQRALDVINAGAKVKGRNLSAIKCKPQKDPFEKAQKEKKENGKVELKSMEECEEALKNAVAPLQGMSYHDQLQQKAMAMSILMKTEIENEIVKANEEISKVIHAKRIKNLQTLQTGPRCEMLPIIESPVKFGYRNKNEFSIGCGPTIADSKLTVGFRLGAYCAGTLTVMEPKNLSLISEKVVNVVERFQQFFRDSGFEAFDNQTHQGYWRTLIIRTTQSGQMMAIVAMNPQKLSNDEVGKVIEDIRSFCSSDVTIASSGLCSLFFSRVGSSNRETDQKFELIDGVDTIKETLKDMTFNISPDAFFQANTAGAELLVDTIKSLLTWDASHNIIEPSTSENDLSACGSVLLDVCCGTGTIGLSLAEAFDKVIGIELVPKAIEDAKKNAAQNSITNVEFRCGKAEDILPDLLESQLKQSKNLVAVVDPPRAGLHKRVLNALRRCESIKRFVYVSCNPKLAKKDFIDLARAPSKRGLQGAPFLPKVAIPVDLFPQTSHCELAILFERVTEEQVKEAEEFMKNKDCHLDKETM